MMIICTSNQTDRIVLSARAYTPALMAVTTDLLTREFAWLVVIAFVIAVPVANYFAGEWLQQYEVRAEIKWWIFALAGIAAMLITLLTVSFHALKAAMGNPVKSLRPE